MSFIENQINNIIEEFKAETLLKIAATVLAFISAITTAKGFMLFWNEETYFAYFISWSFAIAVSMALVFASWRISSALRKGGALPIIIVFLMFAFLSFFFNFNFLYGRFTGKETMRAEAKEIRRDIINMQQRSKLALDDKISYSKVLKRYDSLKAEAEFEHYHPQRRGRGSIYASIYARLPSAKADSSLVSGQYNLLANRIDELAQKALREVTTDSTDMTKNNLEKATDGYNQIGSLTQSIDSSFVYNYKQVKGISTEPDYAFTAFISFWTFNLQGGKNAYSAVFLSMLISFLLDFPIFIAFIILNWRKNSNQKEMPKDLFGDGNNTIKSGKSNKYEDWDWD